MYTPRNLVLLATSTAVLLVRSGAWRGWFFLKSTMISIFWPHSGSGHCPCASPPTAPPPLWRPGRWRLWWDPSPLCCLQPSQCGWWHTWGRSHVSSEWTAEGSGHSGEPVLRVMTLEVFCRTRTDCGLSLRTSSTQLHMGVLKPRRSTLSISCWEMILLNPELKSRNNSHTWVLFSSRCARLSEAV